MATYYELLDVPAGAPADRIDAAYQRQRERYSPERVADLGDDVRRVAAERLAELEQAYVLLSDPERRRAHDTSIGAVQPSRSAPTSSGLGRREILLSAAGALIGLLIIVVVWNIAGRSAASAPAPVAATNKPARAFTLTDINGRDVSLEDYRGKVVMLNFWWTGCEPCKEETPALQSAYQQLADDGLVIVGVNTRNNERNGDDGDNDVRNFVAEYNVTYPVLFDRDGTVGKDYQVYVLPTTVIIDQNGTERFRSFSAVTVVQVEQIFYEVQREATAQR